MDSLEAALALPLDPGQQLTVRFELVTQLPRNSMLFRVLIIIHFRKLVHQGVAQDQDPSPNILLPHNLGFV